MKYKLSKTSFTNLLFILQILYFIVAYNNLNKITLLGLPCILMLIIPVNILLNSYTKEQKKTRSLQIFASIILNLIIFFALIENEKINADIIKGLVLTSIIATIFFYIPSHMIWIKDSKLTISKTIIGISGIAYIILITITALGIQTTLDPAIKHGLAAFSFWLLGYYAWKGEFWITGSLLWAGSVYQIYKYIKLFI